MGEVVYRVRFHCGDRVLAFPLIAERYLLGSGGGADIRLPAPEVSRRHAELARRGLRFAVRDLGSRNGTYVGGERVDEAWLEPHQEFSLGPVVGVIEEVSAGDLEPALAVAGGTVAVPPEAAGTREVTAPLPLLVRELVAAAVGRAIEGGDLASVARVVGSRLVAAVPGCAVRIALRDSGGETPLFAAGALHREPLQQAVARRADGREIVLSWTVSEAARSCDPAVAGELVVGVLAAIETPPAGAAEERRSPPSWRWLVGDSRPMRRLLDYVERLAPTPVHLLLLGDSGTGKELLAREIHHRSPRREGPFVALNCGALPRDLLEAELFGIAERVATGVAARPGRFELADRGTLFLDEVCDMSPETQTAMLRVLQEKCFYRLGGKEPRAVDVRVLAATNRDVEAEIAAGRFRADLYYRLAGDTLRLPRLAERPDDVPLLLHTFLERFSREMRRPVAGVSRSALELLVRYPWPGNVRQLENEARRLVALAPHGGLIDTGLLSEPLRQGDPETAPEGRGGTLDAALAAAERRIIEAALAAEGGNVAATARRLGTSRPGLYQRLARLGIAPRRR